MQNRSNPNTLIKVILQYSSFDTFKNTLKLKFYSLNVIQLNKTIFKYPSLCWKITCISNRTCVSPRAVLALGFSHHCSRLPNRTSLHLQQIIRVGRKSRVVMIKLVVLLGIPQLCKDQSYNCLSISLIFKNRHIYIVSTWG